MQKRAMARAYKKWFYLNKVIRCIDTDPTLLCSAIFAHLQQSMSSTVNLAEMLSAASDVTDDKLISIAS